MTGSFVTRAGTLHPLEWKKRLAGGRMVGLAGDISRDGTTFSGTVDGEGCGRFSLRKTPPR